MNTQKLNDKWFRFFGIPVCAVLGHIIFFNSREPGEEQGLGIFFLSLIEVVILWEINRLVIRQFRNKYPALQQTNKRLKSILIWCIIVTIILRSLNIMVYDIVEVPGQNLPFEVYLKNILIALFFVLLLAGMYEAIYYFRKWKDVAVEAEALKKENLQTQLDSLKMQINPHFLFNSLGSLSSLIDEDTQKAQAFLRQMSSAYRYLLKANDTPLITLREEMDFIKAYSDMLSTRFADGLQLDICLDEKYMDWFLPPLTLQLLLENAVKHNIVLPAKQLLVKIFSHNNFVVVENNLQPKSNVIVSSKTGLKNITAKYRLLKQSNVKIEETATHFRVELPLIKNKEYEGIDS